MQRVANERMIKRRAQAGKFLTYTGVATLVGGLILSFTRREPTAADQTMVSILAILGMLCWQAGFALTNRWGNSPRRDEVLDKALKGLSKEYTIVHYMLGAKHVLFGPSGIFVLVPQLSDGEILYENQTWIQIRKGRRGLRRKKLGRIEGDVEIERRALQKKLARVMPENQIPTIRGILVFIHPDVKVSAGQDTPESAVYAKKLKAMIRKLPTLPGLDPLTLDKLLSDQ